MQQQLAVDGQAVCAGLGSLSPVSIPTDQQQPTSVTVRGSDAENACDQVQQDLFNGADPISKTTVWPSLWELSQVVATTLDVPSAQVSAATRAAYASEVLLALHYYPNGPFGCNPLLNTGGYRADPYFCGGLAANTTGGDRFYDDNAWVGTDLADAYRWSCPTPGSWSGCNKQLADAAVGLAGFEVTGVDFTSTKQFNGIYFCLCVGTTGDGSNRPTVVNADAANFPAALYGVDNAAYNALNNATIAYQWVRSTLELTGVNAGVFYDHITPSNTVEGAPDQSYANGLMIGTAWKLYQAAQSGAIPQAGYVNQAEAYAEEADAHFQNDLGSQSSGGYAAGWKQTNGEYFMDLEEECPAYDAVLFHYLWPLDAAGVSTKPRLGGYVDWLLNVYKDGTATFIGDSYACSNPHDADYMLPHAGEARTLIDTLAYGP